MGKGDLSLGGGGGGGGGGGLVGLLYGAGTFHHGPEHVGGSLSHLPVAPMQWRTTVSVLPTHDMLTEISGAALLVFFCALGASIAGHPSEMQHNCIIFSHLNAPYHILIRAHISNTSHNCNDCIIFSHLNAPYRILIRAP